MGLDDELRDPEYTGGVSNKREVMAGGMIDRLLVAGFLKAPSAEKYL